MKAPMNIIQHQLPTVGVNQVNIFVCFWKKQFRKTVFQMTCSNVQANLLLPIEERDFIMKRILNILLYVSLILIMLCGCSMLSNVSVTEDTLTAGKEYTVNDLFTTDEENLELSMIPDKINAASLDPIEVTLQVKNGNRVEEKQYEFKVVDTTAPEIKQIKETITENEVFDVNNFVEVSDNVDSPESIKINITSGNVDTSTVGEYRIDVEAVDLSNNSASTSMIINVEPKQTELVEGATYTSKYESTEIQFTFNGATYQDEIYTHSTNMFAQYYKNQSDSQYLVIKLFIENLGGNSINYDEIIDPKLLVDNKYNYNLQQLDMNSSVCSQFWSLNPLESQDVYLFYSVPNKIIDKEFEVSFTIGGIPYVYHHSQS